ncbi:hypothetical protein BD410DRAFT_206359 [Rickenella mellea]|uniref:Transmembrane protein n=1 Tax=Rickenella mellea TaxID=50990 RepID=A0A4Y7Q4E1_9AGAM|nr:hypothetical protein BD410DRAFT_206359 [Rickenella mellea]
MQTHLILNSTQFNSKHKTIDTECGGEGGGVCVYRPVYEDGWTTIQQYSLRRRTATFRVFGQVEFGVVVAVIYFATVWTGYAYCGLTFIHRRFDLLFFFPPHPTYAFVQIHTQTPSRRPHHSMSLLSTIHPSQIITCYRYQTNTPLPLIPSSHYLLSFPLCSLPLCNSTSLHASQTSGTTSIHRIHRTHVSSYYFCCILYGLLL